MQNKHFLQHFKSGNPTPYLMNLTTINKRQISALIQLFDIDIGYGIIFLTVCSNPGNILMFELMIRNLKNLYLK